MSKLKVIDLFCGSGGLSMGAKQAGMQVVAGIDRDPSALQTYARNFPSALTIKRDLSTLDPEFLELLPPCDLIVSGPPCQSFSTSNQRTRTNENPLNNLLFIPVSIAERIRPKVVVVENVHGLSIGTRKAYLEELIGQFSAIGYNTSVGLISGVCVGLPQNRTRIFVIATEKKIDSMQFNATQQPTVEDAIGDLPLLENGHSADEMPYSREPLSDFARILRDGGESCRGHLVTNNAAHIIDRYRFVPQGGNWESIPRTHMENYADVTRCHTGIYHRLSNQFPAKVVGNFRKNMLIHPTQHRGLSVREAARLQSFPDHYDFVGSIGKQQQQVGNAVPPLMAKRVLSELVERIW